MRLTEAFYRRDARVVGRELIGHMLVTFIDGVRTSGIITETEAYLGEGDAASHSYRGPTGRNRPMFLAGGVAYVYFIYGMYYCFNVVTGSEGVGEAVLIRGLAPVDGIDAIRRRRCARRPNLAPKRDTELTNGPGKLTIALGITPEHNGADLITNTEVWIEQGTAVSDDAVEITPRIGITKSVEHPWRWVRR